MKNGHLQQFFLQQQQQQQLQQLHTQQISQPGRDKIVIAKKTTTGSKCIP
jgi:hypothetical protein